MTVTTEPWSDDSLSLLFIPLAALDALRSEDLPKARALLPPSLVFQTNFIISSGCVHTWRYRYRQLQEKPEDAAWVTRLVVLRATDEVIGRAGFHGSPDERGMVEMGYEIDPLHRRQGYGMSVLKIMLHTARSSPGIKVARASVGPENLISRNMVLRQGFTKVGEEMDEEDGLEEVYELPLMAGDD